MANAATFISQSVPSTMEAGSVQSVSVTFQNSGSTTWTPWNGSTGYRVSSRNPTDNWRWLVNNNRINLPSTVTPGNNITITFDVTAPQVPGAYDFQWGIIQEGVEHFSSASTNVSVTITNPSTRLKPLSGATTSADSINSGLLALLLFNEGSGTSIGTQGSFTASLANTPTWATVLNSPVLRFNYPSQASQSMSLTTPSAWNNLSALTVVQRIYLYTAPDTSTFEHFWQSRWNSGSGDKYLLFRPNQANGAITLLNTTGQSITDGAPDDYTGAWHTYAITFNNSTGAANILIDGSSAASGTLTSGLTTGTCDYFSNFAGDNSSYYLQADVDVMRIYNRVLSSNELLSLHLYPYQGVTAPSSSSAKNGNMFLTF